MQQILFNLLSNAVKFTEDGTIYLEVRRDLVQGEEEICFDIGDDGIGMTPQQQQKLFQPFIQIGGTGLGLAITKQFTEMMGGRINVKSEFGEGSTFSVYLPVQVAEPLTKERNIDDNLDELLNTEGHHGIVLVIDDDENTQRLFKNYLSKMGYAVAVATGGEVRYPDYYDFNDRGTKQGHYTRRGGLPG